MGIDSLDAVGKIAGALLSIGGFTVWAFKYLPNWSRWIMSLKIVKRDELNRLREMEPKYQQCEAELKGLRETCAPYLEQLRRDLVKKPIAGTLSPQFQEEREEFRHSQT
jgi:hypothetical protein